MDLQWEMLSKLFLVLLALPTLTVQFQPGTIAPQAQPFWTERHAVKHPDDDEWAYQKSGLQFKDHRICFFQDFNPFLFYFLQQETILSAALSCTHYTIYHNCSEGSNHLPQHQTMSYLSPEHVIHTLTELGCSGKVNLQPQCWRTQ